MHRILTLITISLLSFVVIFSADSVYSASLNSTWRPTLIAGYGFSHANQTQTVHLASTPPPGLDNRYVGGNLLHGSVLLGIALERETGMQIKDIYSMAGFELDYMRNLAVNGRVKPMYNVSPNFNRLKYFYDIHSVAAQVSAKLIKKNLFHSAEGYLQGGTGIGLNRMSDYREYTPNGSTASPMLAPFKNHDTLNAVFSAGTGISWHIMHNQTLSAGYRFFYTGKSRLSKSPVEQTNDSIVLSPITYNFLILSLTI